ncbi:MAG: NUDIX domain-containing protein [Actinobacteria bacterium]|nr:NUDIX domain-containing protein [Actinomycetota bacterium]
MSHLAVHVAALVVSGDDFLMLRQHNNWALPATAVRYGETLAEAVVRALGEQAGVAEAICGPFIGWAESIDTDTDIDTSQSHTLSMYFRAVLLDSTTQPASQAAEVRWIPSWDAAELGLADGLAEFLGEHGLIETLI